MFRTILVDTHEGIDVVTLDVPGSFLHEELSKDKKMFMILRSEFVDIICDINPQYQKYITYEKSKKVLYLHVIQSSYVCIEESIFWYDFSENTL